jgi:hypothetical protein
MTPHLFIAKWKRSNLSEMSAYQQHFLDLCDVLGEKKPADVDPDGTWYTFQKGLTTTEDTKGWADVWLRNCFGWEYKGKHKDLKAAYQQLLKYREALENPPLLIVCDLDRFDPFPLRELLPDGVIWASGHQQADHWLSEVAASVSGLAPSGGTGVSRDSRRQLLASLVQ